MISIQRVAITLIACFVVMTVGACAKKPVADVASAPVQEEPATIAVPAPVPSAATLTTLAGTQLQPVYFEYDSHVLSVDARQVLTDNAALLRQNAGMHIIIEGHCDERGSDEYNLALGAERANAVLQYLLGLGIEPERLSSISYGEERPAVPGNDEAAWTRNRRAAFN